VKIRLEPTDVEDYPTIEISIPTDDCTINVMWDDVIRPLLLAWGFSAETVDGLIDEVR